MKSYKDSGKKLNLYSEMVKNFGNVKLNMFNVILGHMDTSVFTESDIEEMKNSFPKSEPVTSSEKNEWRHETRNCFGRKVTTDFLNRCKVDNKNPEDIEVQREFAKEFKCNFGKFRHFLKKYTDVKCEDPRNITTEEQKEEIKSLFDQELSIAEISKLTGVKMATVHRIGLINGWNKHSRGPQKKRKKVQDSEIQEPISKSEIVREIAKENNLEIKEYEPTTETQTEVPSEVQPEVESEPKFEAYLNGAEAVERLNKYCKEVLPVKLWESSEAFGEFCKELVEKYKTSKSATKKWLQDQMKVQKKNSLSKGFENLELIRESLKTEILKKLSEISEPTDDVCEELKILNSKLSLFNSLSDQLKCE